MTKHSARAVMDAFIRQAVYHKLANTLPVDGLVWMKITDVIRHVDPEEFNRSKYSKYVLALDLDVQIKALEEQCFITSRGSLYAISDILVRFISRQPKKVVDAYLDNHLKEP